MNIIDIKIMKNLNIERMKYYDYLNELVPIKSLS